MMISERIENKRRKDLLKGFTLIEVLVTTVVIALGCLGALHLQSLSMMSGSMADQNTVAAFLAESKLEALRAISFTDMTPGKTTTMCTREASCCEKTDSSPCVGKNPATNENYPNYQYEIVTNIISGQPTSFSNRIEIQINWKDVYGRRTLKYDAAVTNFSFQ